MEKIIALPEEAEEARTRLPIVPIAFGSGSKCPSADEAHLLLSVRAGSLSYTDLSGEETADEGQLLFVRRGHTLPDLAPSADFDCEFVLFDAAGTSSRTSISTTSRRARSARAAGSAPSPK